MGGCGFRARSCRRGRLLRRPDARARRRGAVARVGQIECPILALQAGADPHITAEDNAAFEEALTGAGIEHEIVRYEGAPHSFFDRKQEEFQADSDDAWRRTLEFIARNA